MLSATMKKVLSKNAFYQFALSFKTPLPWLMVILHLHRLYQLLFKMEM